MSVAGEPRKKIGIRINAFSLFATTKKEINLVALIIFDHSTDKNLFCRNNFCSRSVLDLFYSDLGTRIMRFFQLTLSSIHTE